MQISVLKSLLLSLALGAPTLGLSATAPWQSKISPWLADQYVAKKTFLPAQQTILIYLKDESNLTYINKTAPTQFTDEKVIRCVHCESTLSKYNLSRHMGTQRFQLTKMALQVRRLSKKNNTPSPN